MGRATFARSHDQEWANAPSSPVARPRRRGSPQRRLHLRQHVGFGDAGLLAIDHVLHLPHAGRELVAASNCGDAEAPLVGGTPFHDLDRFVLNHRAGVLAILDDAGDKVHLHPLDLKALLAKAGGDYLLVMSQPPAAAKGQKWTYTPDVWSKTGKAVIKVETGPPGMTATGGAVTWAVPKDFAEGEAQVILTVSDGGKQETFQTFALPVGPPK